MRITASSVFLPGLLLGLIQLCGCRFAGDLVAAAAGGASAAASANPAVGLAVGVGVQAGLDATVSYIVRKRQQAEQDAIATEVATMDDGERRPWKIEHDIPIGNEHGEVHVTRVIDTALTSCKEIVFSVETDGASPTNAAFAAMAIDGNGRSRSPQSNDGVSFNSGCVKLSMLGPFRAPAEALQDGPSQTGLRYAGVVCSVVPRDT